MVALAAASNQTDVTALALALDRAKQDVSDMKDELSENQTDVR